MKAKGIDYWNAGITEPGMYMNSADLPVWYAYAWATLRGQHYSTRTRSDRI